MPRIFTTHINRNRVIIYINLNLRGRLQGRPNGERTTQQNKYGTEITRQEKIPPRGVVTVTRKLITLLDLVIY